MQENFPSASGLSEELTVYSLQFKRGGTIGKSNRRDDHLAGGWRIQSTKTSWVAFPFGFGMGGPLFARHVVADLQACPDGGMGRCF
jgi:hypothetical protein